MWLAYGVDAHQALIAIADVPRGKSPLRCPYCGGPLTAKKGRIKQHHFAHTDATCRAVARGCGQTASPWGTQVPPTLAATTAASPSRLAS